LDALGTMLSKLDASSFHDLLGILEESALSYEDLTGGVQAIGYRLSDVNTQFQEVYARGFTDVPAEAMGSIVARWQNEILGAAQIAARSQGALSNLAKSTTEARAILSRSEASSGQVAQMQSIVQMLGLMQAQNTAVLQSLTTTGRVLATTSAAAASERQLV